ncbi:hypothetical protein IRB23SM22_02610 [Alkalibacterium sp. s-m-22]
MKLDEIGDIKLGIALNRKKAEIDSNIKERYSVVSVKNVNEEGYFNNESFDIFLSTESLSQRYFAQTGDILMRLTDPNTAVYVSQEQDGLLIPSYFVQIKIYDKRYLPEYVAWYLNSEQTKRELRKVQSGTRVTSTSKKVLGTLEIKELPVDKQQKLIEMTQLHQKEKMLYKRIIKEKEKQLAAATAKIMAD